MLLQLFFIDILKKYNITEYYLLETPSNFLLINNSGKTYGLYIQSDDYKKEIIEEAKEAQLSQALIDELQTSHKILCYHNSSNPSFPEYKEWGKYLQNATEIYFDDRKYFFSYVENGVDLDKDEICLL